MKKKQYMIYTDGSCLGNPGPGGWAAIILNEDDKEPFAVIKGCQSFTTNNRMEMTAIIKALRYIHDHGLEAEKINLYSDSNLIVQTLLKNWKRKANLDLWRELDELNYGLNVNFTWVKAHHKSYWNNECDRLAQGEARKCSL